MFLIIAAVIDNNGRGLAAPGQDEGQGQGQGQGDAVTLKPANACFHESPFGSVGASVE